MRDATRHEWLDLRVLIKNEFECRSIACALVPEQKTREVLKTNDWGDRGNRSQEPQSRDNLSCSAFNASIIQLST